MKKYYKIVMFIKSVSVTGHDLFFILASGICFEFNENHDSFNRNIVNNAKAVEKIVTVSGLNGLFLIKI